MSKWQARTRGGYPVNILATHPAQKFMYVGEYHMRGKGWVPGSWDQDGVCDRDGRLRMFPWDADLVRLAPVVDWSRQPVWCKALALDIAGLWYRFDYVPKRRGSIWHKTSDGAFSQRLHPSEYPDWQGAWEDSLCVRP